MVMQRNFKNGDIVTNGSEQLIKGSRALALSVIYRLRMVKGEDFMNINNGTPWFDGILGHVDISDAESLIRQQILKTPSVAGLSSFTFDYDKPSRSYTVDATIIGRNGETAVVAYSGETF